jgi:antitoxin VapB
MVERHGGKVESMAALNIKSEEAYRLVRELAELEGKSMTTVVVEAVQEKLDRERKPQINEERMNYWLEYGKRIRQATPPELLTVDINDLLYDEYGLPK